MSLAWAPRAMSRAAHVPEMMWRERRQLGLEYGGAKVTARPRLAQRGPVAAAKDVLRVVAVGREVLIELDRERRRQGELAQPGRGLGQSGEALPPAYFLHLAGDFKRAVEEVEVCSLEPRELTEAKPLHDQAIFFGITEDARSELVDERDRRGGELLGSVRYESAHVSGTDVGDGHVSQRGQKMVSQ
jgi:hypothetical protein